jgi:hypothetical protein
VLHLQNNRFGAIASGLDHVRAQCLPYISNLPPCSPNFYSSLVHFHLFDSLGQDTSAGSLLCLQPSHLVRL